MGMVRESGGECHLRDLRCSFQQRQSRTMHTDSILVNTLGWTEKEVARLHPFVAARPPLAVGSMRYEADLGRGVPMRTERQAIRGDDLRNAKGLKGVQAGAVPECVSHAYPGSSQLTPVPAGTARRSYIRVGDSS